MKKAKGNGLELTGRIEKDAREDDNFAVEWSVNPYAEEQVSTLYFADAESANIFAESVLEHNYHGVWISEFARFRTIRANKLTSGWIYTWWSGAVEKTSWGKRPGSGYGVPDGATSVVPYTRIGRSKKAE